MATGNLLLFARETKTERVLLALNFGSEPVSMSFPSARLSGRILVSSLGDRDHEIVKKTIDLRDNEGVVVELDSATVLP
jgi:alpha-glucosidase